MKKPSAGIRILSIVLCILLCISMMAGILIASVRVATTKENTARIIRQALFSGHTRLPRASAPGFGARAAGQGGLSRLALPRLESDSGVMNELLVDLLYDALSQELGAGLSFTREDLAAFVEESTLKDELSNLAGSLVSDLVNGENTTVLDEATVARLLTENAALIESHFGYTLTEDEIAEVSAAVAESSYVRQLQQEGIGNVLLDAYTGTTGSDDAAASDGITPENPITQLLETFRTYTSAWAMLLCFGVALVCIVVLCIVNRKWLWYALRKIGIGLLVGSLPALLPTILAAVLAGLWNTLFAELRMVGSVVGMILQITAPICVSAFAAGVVLIILASVFKSRAKKNAALCDTTASLSAQLTEEEPAAQTPDPI